MTEEQANDLISIIDSWYLMWKERMTGEPGVHPRPQHRLGFAKEELKSYVYEYCKRQYEPT